MKVTIFGANGRVGRIVVRKLLENGHTVKAFVYGNHSLIESPSLLIIQGDIENKELVSDAASGSDVIISTLGSWGTKNKNVLSKGMSNIIPAAKRHGVSKIISLTGADAIAPGEKNNPLRCLARILLKIYAKKILYDGEYHIVLLKNGGVNWTVVRSPIMNDIGKGSDYNFTKQPLSPWQTVSRDSVAASIVDLVDLNVWINQAPFISRK